MSCYDRKSEGFDINWFSIQPEVDLICTICLDVLNDPCKCSNNHAFCKVCLEHCVADRRVCPICRTYIQVRYLVRDEVRRRKVDALPVTCCSCMRNEANSNKICMWTGTLKEYYERVDLCVFNRSEKEHLLHHVQMAISPTAAAPLTRHYVHLHSLKLLEAMK